MNTFLFKRSCFCDQCNGHAKSADRCLLERPQSVALDGEWLQSGSRVGTICPELLATGLQTWAFLMSVPSVQNCW